MFLLGFCMPEILQRINTGLKIKIKKWEIWFQKSLKLHARFFSSTSHFIVSEMLPCNPNQIILQFGSFSLRLKNLEKYTRALRPVRKYIMRVNNDWIHHQHTIGFEFFNVSLDRACPYSTQPICRVSSAKWSECPVQFFFGCIR